jgi:TolA-binding protein
MNNLKNNVRARVYISLILMGLSLITGCAYFNTFYLARKNFNDAERLRRKNNDTLDPKSKKAYNDAIDWSTEILKNFKDSRYVDDSLFIIGMSNFYLRDYVSAEQKFSELLQYFPQSDLALSATYHKAITLIELDRNDEAILILSNIINSKNRELKGLAGLALARINQDGKDWDGLLAAADRVIESEPLEGQYNEAVYLKGEALYNKAEYQQAIETLLVLKNKKLNSELKFRTNSLIARTNATIGRYDSAMEYLTSMQNRGEFSSFEPRIRLEIGKIYEMQNKPDDAIDIYTKLAGDFPDSIAAKEAWYNIGTLLIKDIENAKEAQNAFKKVREGRAPTGQSWFIDAQIKTVQIDSLLSKLNLIDRLTGKNTKSARETTAADSSKLHQSPENHKPTNEMLVKSIETTSAISDTLNDVYAKNSGKEADLKNMTLTGTDSVLIIIPHQGNSLAVARFSLAELYTYSFNRPDSASTQYQLIIQESPGSEFAIKSEYFIELQRMQQDSTYTAERDREIMQHLIERYPQSEFAQQLKVYLGIIEQKPDEQLYAEAERARMTSEKPEVYLPMLENIIKQYPGSLTAYRTRFFMAYCYEHDLGDWTRAQPVYKALAEEKPGVVGADYVKLAGEKLRIMEQQDKLLADSKKNIAFYETMIRDLDSGRGTETLTAQNSGMDQGTSLNQDDAYSGLKKIRARNARIHSRYYSN